MGLGSGVHWHRYFGLYKTKKLCIGDSGAAIRTSQMVCHTLCAMNENRAATAEMEAPPMPILTAKERLQRATTYADTLGEVSGQIDTELRILEEEVEQGIIDASDGTAKEIRQALVTRQTVIAPLASEYSSVQVAQLEPGVGGMAPVGGEVSEIYVSAGQVASGDFQDLQGILVHEERHTGQVELLVGEGIPLIVDGQAVEDDTVLLEGDTETHVIDVTGYDRDDRPEAVYEEGKIVADAIQENHAELWNTVLTETGNVADLQNAVWIDGVEQGTLSAEQIVDEADQTGHMFNETFIAAQNTAWASAMDSGKLTAQEVQEVAEQLDIELSPEVGAAILQITNETRERYMQGPQTKAAYSL